jgi:hypothetical protein
MVYATLGANVYEPVTDLDPFLPSSANFPTNWRKLSQFEEKGPSRKGLRVSTRRFERKIRTGLFNAPRMTAGFCGDTG